MKKFQKSTTDAMLTGADTHGQAESRSVTVIKEFVPVAGFSQHNAAEASSSPSERRVLFRKAIDDGMSLFQMMTIRVVFVNEFLVYPVGYSRPFI